MKVHLVIGAYPPSIGGAQIHTAALARALTVHAGVEVRVSCLWRESRSDWLRGSTIRLRVGTRREIADGIPVDEVGLISSPTLRDLIRVPFYYPFRVHGARAFARRLDYRHEDEDVVHIVRLGREHLAWRALRDAQARGKPVFLTPNHHPRWSRRPDPAWRHIYRNVDGVFALTQTEKDELVSLGVAPEKVWVTGIGPVLAEEAGSIARLRQAHSLPPGRFLCVLGQQFDYKRIDLSIAAFEELAETHDDLSLVIAGPISPRTVSLRDASPKRDRIFVLGPVSLEDKTTLLREAEVLLFPSEQESFGGVLIEAAASGTPYVARDIPQLVDVAGRIGGGTCVPGDAVAIARAAADLMEGRLRFDPADVRRRIDETFSWPRLADAYKERYEEILSAHQSRDVS